jgi:hypothetical protein
MTKKTLFLCRHEYSVLNAESAEILTLLFPRNAVNIPYVLQVILRYTLFKDQSILFYLMYSFIVSDIIQKCL